MTHASLFSGIGGFDLAAEWMGWHNVFHCEWNPFGQKILKHYWPNAESYGDITKTNFTKYANRIDILTGGFPCQPFSIAGKRKGTEDERHLWPEMLRAIREIKPRWVVGENVSGILSWDGGLVFEQVHLDLEAQGYEVQAFILPACAVNAPHRRDRVWFVAHSKQEGRGEGRGPVINAKGWEMAESKSFNGKGIRNADRPSDKAISTTDTHIIGCNNGGDNREERHFQGNIGITEENKSKWEGRECGPREIGEVDVTYSQSGGLEGHGGYTKTSRFTGKKWSVRFGSGTGKPNVNNPISIGRNDTVTHEYGHIEQKVSETPQREFIGTDSGQNKSWSEFPISSPVCSRNDGISDRLDTITISRRDKTRILAKNQAFGWWRKESIKAGGNAVVPQVVYQIFKAIESL